MYVLLTGTRKNAGDFLIAHAAKRLFERFAPTPEFVELPSFRPLTPHLERVNAARALILCGGPAYQRGLGQHFYQFLDELDQIRVPIISFGLGWKSSPGDDYDLRHFRFPDRARPLLERIATDFQYAGCRDYLTWRVLNQAGAKNAWMTGCPVWHDPDYFDQPLVVPEVVRNVVFTPAEHPVFREQSIELFGVVRAMFPEARIVCSFHRGWTADEFTPAARAENAQAIRRKVAARGAETWDASGSADKLLRYVEFDLHVGYRVHAHLKMLSARRPSILVAEDGRGRAALAALGTPGVSGWRGELPLRSLEGILPPVVLSRARVALGGLGREPNAAWQLRSVLEEECSTGFARFHGALATMDATRERMLRLLRALP